MVESDHPRLILHNFLPLHLCKELEFIHKSCCTVGYRPNVFSTTLSHLIATNCGHLILPFVSIRERLKEKVEEFFGCEYELFIEFTGLISWTKGSSIGWHSDDNRSYLKQRDFAAVCYLNSYGKEFNGGLFHFQDGEPQTVVPAAGLCKISQYLHIQEHGGLCKLVHMQSIIHYLKFPDEVEFPVNPQDAIMYTADSRNIHSVDEIIDGERLTLTLWFSRDSQHDEDAKLISHLSQTRSSGLVEPVSHLPLPASSNMYWFSPGDSPNHQPGFDIRLARVHIFGYVFCLLDDEIHKFTSDSSFDLSELLMKPLWLAREGQMFNKQFVNSLHALQVVQFYCWKEFELKTSDRVWEGRSASQLIRSQPETSIAVELVHPNDLHLAKLVFHCVSYDESMQKPFSWEVFSTAVSTWEDYTSKLQNELLASLPYWKTHQSIFPISSLGITEDHIDFSKCP